MKLGSVSFSAFAFRDRAADADPLSADSFAARGCRMVRAPDSLGPKVVEEFRDDRETADADTGGELGVGPQAHGDDIVTFVGRLDDPPGVVRA